MHVSAWPARERITKLETKESSLGGHVDVGLRNHQKTDFSDFHVVVCLSGGEQNSWFPPTCGRAAGRTTLRPYVGFWLAGRGTKSRASVR
jgi:hypothetical protein